MMEACADYCDASPTDKNKALEYKSIPWFHLARTEHQSPPHLQELVLRPGNQS